MSALGTITSPKNWNSYRGRTKEKKRKRFTTVTKGENVQIDKSLSHVAVDLVLKRSWVSEK